MNKTELIGEIAAKTGLTKAEAKKKLDAFIKTMEKAMEKGDKVTLKGFGSFSVINKSARKGVNPRTNKYINIPAHKVVKFKPGTELAGCV
jgi:DNA-binding protein HU-beta